MDMSFSLADAAPLARSPLDYRTLVATLDASRAPACHDDEVPGTQELAIDGSTALLRLAETVIGGPGWQDAARAMGGRFAVLSDAR